MVSKDCVLRRTGCARRIKARTKRGNLRRARVEVALRQAVCVGKDKIRVDKKLVFVRTPWQAISREAYATGDLLGRRNEEGSVGNLQIQQFQSNWIDVGAVASHRNATERPALPTEFLAEHSSR